MITDLNEIREKLKSILTSYDQSLRVRVDKEANFEVCGTIEAMQGKKKVDGMYFASLVPKPKDIRWYFFPSYTHADRFENLSSEMQKMKKGKSCFHIKQLNDELISEIEEMVATGVTAYQEDGLLA